MCMDNRQELGSDLIAKLFRTDLSKFTYAWKIYPPLSEMKKNILPWLTESQLKTLHTLLDTVLNDSNNVDKVTDIFIKANKEFEQGKSQEDIYKTMESQLTEINKNSPSIDHLKKVREARVVLGNVLSKLKDKSLSDKSINDYLKTLTEKTASNTKIKGEILSLKNFKKDHPELYDILKKETLFIENKATPSFFTTSVNKKIYQIITDSSNYTSSGQATDQMKKALLDAHAEIDKLENLAKQIPGIQTLSQQINSSDTSTTKKFKDLLIEYPQKNLHEIKEDFDKALHDYKKSISSTHPFELLSFELNTDLLAIKQYARDQFTNETIYFIEDLQKLKTTDINDPKWGEQFNKIMDEYINNEAVNIPDYLRSNPHLKSSPADKIQALVAIQTELVTTLKNDTAAVQKDSLDKIKDKMPVLEKLYPQILKDPANQQALFDQHTKQYSDKDKRILLELIIDKAISNKQPLIDIMQFSEKQFKGDEKNTFRTHTEDMMNRYLPNESRHQFQAKFKEKLTSDLNNLITRLENTSALYQPKTNQHDNSKQLAITNLKNEMESIKKNIKDNKFKTPEDLQKAINTIAEKRDVVIQEARKVQQQSILGLIGFTKSKVAREVAETKEPPKIKR